MKICANGIDLDIDDRYIVYSPVLNTMITSGIGFKDENDIVHIQDDPFEIQQYLNFLQGLEFEWNEDIASLFDFMGHENKMKYPLGYWEIKLQDNWIRDNFYKYELYNDPYYGLVQIPIVNPLPLIMTNNVFIAGGACLYMAGGSDSFKDIDMFFTDKESALLYMRTVNNHVQKTDNSIYFNISQLMDVRPKNKKHRELVYKYTTRVVEEIVYSDILMNKTVQFILRLYKSPSEIVHGFDVDCVGILYDGTSLWATRRAVYSLHHKVNHFDPERSSPSYAYRLSKYQTRGFSIQLPHFDLSLINQERLGTLWNIITEHYIEEMRENQRYSKKIDNPSRSLNTVSQMLQYSIDAVRSLDIKFLIETVNHYKLYDHPCIHGAMLSRSWSKDIETRKRLIGAIPKDPVSILILSSQYKFHTALWTRSDYNPNYGPKDSISIQRAISLIVWKEQNPMEQVTSTFYPTPVGADSYTLIDWYNKSPLYGTGTDDTAREIMPSGYKYVPPIISAIPDEEFLPSYTPNKIRIESTYIQASNIDINPYDTFDLTIDQSYDDEDE